MFKKVSLLALLLVLALAACGGSPAATSNQSGVTASQPTATPAPTATSDPGVFAAPVGNGGYDSCLDPWDTGRVQEAYQSKASHTGYAATLVLRSWTKEGGPNDADECWRNRHGQYVFMKHDVPITKEAFERLTGARNDLTILAPVYWGEVPAGWEDAVWVHDFFNGLTAEEVQELVNTYGHVLLLVGTMAATGLLISAIIPPVIGAPLAPDCAYNSCG